jgi:hypothetical protein
LLFKPGFFLADRITVQPMAATSQITSSYPEGLNGLRIYPPIFDFAVDGLFSLQPQSNWGCGNGTNFTVDVVKSEGVAKGREFTGCGYHDGIRRILTKLIAELDEWKDISIGTICSSSKNGTACACVLSHHIISQKLHN